MLYMDALVHVCAPCAHDHSLSYLKLIAGSRTVPVELGSRYTDEDWSQKLMTLSEFIDRYVDTKVSCCSCVVMFTENLLMCE